MKERNLQKLYRDQHIPGNYLREYSQYLFHLLANLDFEIIENVANLIIRQAKKGKTVYIIGNGGSATTASHFATDLVHCGLIGHKALIRAVSLADNVSLITALGNDKGYDQIFAQQLNALAKKGDILISISASGNSPNLVEAVKLAKTRGLYTVGLVGFDGGKIAGMADYVVQVKTEKGEYGPVEDLHLFLDHMLTSFIALSLSDTKKKIMEQLNNASLLQVAEGAARAAGALLRPYSATVLSSVGKDIKIDADKAAHTLIVESLKKTGIPALSEEDEAHDFNQALQWVVDPLDGSLNFVRGVPLCAVSIALVKDGEPMLGVVYDFNRDELFSGIAGEGAMLNGKKISVSAVSDKKDAVVMTGFPSYTDYSTGALEKYIATVQAFKKVRLIGSAALSLAYVAAGRADAYFEKDIKIWDVAAGLALVKAAGGVYTQTPVGDGGKCTVFAANTETLTVSL